MRILEKLRNVFGVKRLEYSMTDEDFFNLQAEHGKKGEEAEEIVAEMRKKEAEQRLKFRNFWTDRMEVFRRRQRENELARQANETIQPGEDDIIMPPKKARTRNN